MTEKITEYLEKSFDKKTNATIRAMAGCAIKTGKLSLTKDPVTKDITAHINNMGFPLKNCKSDSDNSVEFDILNSTRCREQIEAAIETALLDMQNADGAAFTKILKALEEAYIQPDGTLHLCIGFYENGDFKTNTVCGRNLPDNIEYNRLMRPGRYYYVDGEYMCGGMVIEEKLPERIAMHKNRIRKLGILPSSHDSAPYV